MKKPSVYYKYLFFVDCVSYNALSPRDSVTKISHSYGAYIIIRKTNQHEVALEAQECQEPLFCLLTIEYLLLVNLTFSLLTYMLSPSFIWEPGSAAFPADRGVSSSHLCTLMFLDFYSEKNILQTAALVQKLTWFIRVLSVWIA